ncbi:MAG: M48 family metalloprotease [Deltaproteobacteria bacterium]|nr:M48 family metalloprotease [Deltaproteobacteria bacterium]NIS78606.1 M48 family metalloprotease [Deltaproteobacteria bacterium]
MNTSRYTEKCEKVFRRSIAISAVFLLLPSLVLVFQADHYLSVIFDSQIILHLCHFLETVVPSVFNLIFLIAAVAFFLFIPAGFFKSIYHLVRGLAFPPFLKPFLPEILKRGDGDRNRVAGYKVVEVDTHVPFALAGGIVDKKIIVSKSLRTLLSREEYDAVLMHEVGHLEMGHPLKKLLVGSMLKALYILPSRKDLLVRFRALTELSADEFAVRRGVNPAVLAGAIVKAARGGQLITESSLTGLTDSQVGERVHALLGIEQARSKVSPKKRLSRGIVKTVPAALLVVFLAQPLLLKPGVSYCYTHGKTSEKSRTISTTLSLCTKIDCMKCTICTLDNREHHSAGS